MITYFVHIPKTAGRSVAYRLHANRKFFPIFKDREHEFGMHNATRRGFAGL